jgi:hypothetical protein
MSRSHIASTSWDGFDLHVDDTGEGDTVVLLHSLTAHLAAHGRHSEPRR